MSADRPLSADQMSVIPRNPVSARSREFPLAGYGFGGEMHRRTDPIQVIKEKVQGVSDLLYTLVTDKNIQSQTAAGGVLSCLAPEHCMKIQC